MELFSVVVNYRTPGLLRRFLASYDAFVHRKGRVLYVADVDPLDNSVIEILKEFPYVIYGYFDTNVGYATAVNDTIYTPHMNAKYIGIFNSDCEFLDSECVDSCLDIMEANPEVGVVGPKQVDRKNRITHAGILGRNAKPLMRGWREPDMGQFNDVLEAVTLSGSALFVRADSWIDMAACENYIAASLMATGKEPLGAFLPTQHFYEETYFIYHLRHHGWKAVYNGKAKMLHEWHQSSPVGSKQEVMRESRKAFRLACDAHGIERD